jgi:hypothetical protein
VSLLLAGLLAGMMDDDSTLPAPTHTGRGRMSTLDQLASIPEEEIWLSKQKSGLNRKGFPWAGGCDRIRLSGIF